jgi:inositol transport system ATP-binding protein
MAKAGIAIVVISSELPEILALADRIVTMREGRVTGEVPGRGASQEQLMTLMTLSIQGTLGASDLRKVANG